jgi:hypothetical protein
MAIKRGIIQARGIGDIVIALPIAKYYQEQGDEIYWPICTEFIDTFREYAPWVNWIAVDTDPQGLFFFNTPLQRLQAAGCDMNEVLYLYQFLSSTPELTDPELYNILKFDQYKYQVAGVPFRNKWLLNGCIIRRADSEKTLADQVKPQGRYAVAHLSGSNTRVDQGLASNFLDPAVRIINIDDYKYTSIFDWIPIIEGAEAVICLDSCIANMVDQLCIDGPSLYWIRRSPWDLTPVLGSAWTIVPTNLPIAEPKRIDPKAEADKKRSQVQAQLAQEQSQSRDSSLQSHVPFQTDKSKIPTNFMHALKK